MNISTNRLLVDDHRVGFTKQMIDYDILVDS